MRQVGRRADRGSATLVVAVCAACLAMLGAAAVTGAALSDAAARAQAAADLGALAAAHHARDDRALGRLDPDAACARARGVVEENGGALERCTVTSRAVVHVEASVPMPGALAGVGVTRSAHAGPAGVGPAGARQASAGMEEPGGDTD